MSYSYEYRYEATTYWYKCKRTYPTLELAAQAAKEWLILCFENDAIIELKLVKR